MLPIKNILNFLNIFSISKLILLLYKFFFDCFKYELVIINNINNCKKLKNIQDLQYQLDNSSHYQLFRQL